MLPVSTHQRLALGLLQALVRGADDPVDHVERRGLLECSMPPDAEARARYLLARLDLPLVALETLGRRWAEAPTGELRPSRLELLKLARGAAPGRSEEEPGTLDRWRRAAEDRLALSPSRRRGRATPDLDHRPLLEEWPRRLLEDREWACAEAPLPEMEPLPLDDVWVDLTLLRPQHVFDLVAGATLSETLDLHYEERRWSATSLESLIDRLAGSAALVGPPGSGKTTVLKWLARRLILDAKGRFLLPLFVPLRSFGRWQRTHPASSLVDYGLARAGVTDAEQRRGWAEVLANRPGTQDEVVLFLLDGWDEVSAEDRDGLREQLEASLHGFSILLTSRPSGFPRNLPLDEIHEILELSPESADTLIHRWFERAGAPEQAPALRRHLERRHDFRRMARNPFLLTLLCGLSLRARRGQRDLPSSRSEIYRQAAELIYAHHNQRYPEARLDQMRQRQVERLAVWLLDEAPDSPRFVFGLDDVLSSGQPAELLEEHLKPSRLLSQWSPAEDSYHFLHTSFHEYLASRALAREPSGKALDRLRRRALNVSWQEVLLFLSGQSPHDGDVFWNEMRRQAEHPDRFGHLFLRLARFVAEAGFTDGGLQALGVDVREPLWYGVLSFTTNEPFVDAYATVDAAGLAERSAEALRTADHRTRIRLLQALARSRSVETSKVLVDQILGGGWRDAAVGLNQLQMYGRVDADDLLRLRKVATASRTRAGVRKRAIRALGYLRDSASIQHLVEVARRSRPMAEEVVVALGSIGGNDATTALREMIDWYDDRQWPMEIVLQLGDVDVPSARDLLLDLLATRELHDDLTVAILSALGEKRIHYGTDLIVTLLESSSLPIVRGRAAMALTGATGPRVREALLEAVRSDPEEVVRSEALDALDTHGRPADVPWLAARVRDRSIGIRERADTLGALLHVVHRHSASDDGPWLLRTAAGEVLEVLKEPKGELAERAALWASMAGQAVGMRLVELCNDEAVDWSIRMWCCRNLGALRFRPAVPALLGWLRRTPDIEDDEELPPFETGQQMSWRAAEAVTKIDPGILLAEPGTASAFALARYALETGSLVFDRFIVGPDGREQARRSEPAPSRTGGIAVTPPSFPAVHAPDLRIVIRHPTPTELAFELWARDPHLGLDGEEFETVRLTRTPQDYSRNLVEDLESLPFEREGMRGIGRTGLAAKGAHLFRTVLPESLQRLLWDLQGRVTTVQIVSEEAHIPWEILKLQRQRGTGSWESGPFLCEAFAVTRWLRDVPEVLSLPLRRIGLVVPRTSDVPAASEERRQILSLRSPERSIEEIPSRLERLVEALRSGFYDGWHIVGHGWSRGEDADRWGLVLEDRQVLTPDHLTESEDLGRNRPWVFLNACHGGRGGLALAGMGGWAKRFLGAGAGTFLGPQWAISGDWAGIFSVGVYRRMLAGLPLAQAARDARLELRAAALGDPAWLSYAVYGHPAAVLGPSDPA